MQNGHLMGTLDKMPEKVQFLENDSVIWTKVHGCRCIGYKYGLPKSFSISGGMGAALLTKPDLIHDSLTTLKRNLDIPVTCKIRLLKSPQDTVELARRIEKTGVSV